jgi:hypothetical protein
LQAQELKQTKDAMSHEYNALKDAAAREIGSIQADNLTRDKQLGEHELKIADHKKQLKDKTTALDDHNGKLDYLYGHTTALEDGMNQVFARTDDLRNYTDEVGRRIQQGGNHIRRVVFEEILPGNPRDDPQFQVQQFFGNVARGIDGDNPPPLPGPRFQQTIAYRPPVVEVQPPPEDQEDWE